jgi:peptide/nickel transport system substrate-binding protein
MVRRTPLLLLALLAACVPAPARQPDSVVVVLDEAPRNLDPRIGTDATSERLIQILFSALVKRAPDYSIEPDLARSWEMPDPLTYIFHLREGVRFHDGRPLTARDVVFTFRSLLDGSLQTPKAGTFRLIEAVDSTDDRTVVFKLKEPFGPFLWNLTLGGIGIVPEGAGPEFARNPVGSGPFKFVRHVPDAEVVIARNEDYYGSRPEVAEVRFKIVPEAIVRALELRKGEVDIALNVLPPDMVETLRGHERLEILQAPGANYQYLAFNLKDPAFRDLRVRRAIAHAIDREKIVEFLFRRQARLATGVVPPGNWAYTADVARYPFDPERARQLLKDAGRPELSFTFRTSTDETTRLLAAVFQEQLRAAGVRMEIRANDAATFAADLEKGNFQAFSRRWIGNNNDPDIFHLIFHSTMQPPEGANRGFYANPEVDRLITLARAASGTVERRAAYQEIQRIVAEELPYISLWYMDNVAVYNRSISGMRLYPAGEYTFLTEVSR